jgi:hypothetical protein
MTRELPKASSVHLVRAVTIEPAAGPARIPLKSRLMRRAWRAAHERRATA